MNKYNTILFKTIDEAIICQIDGYYNESYLKIYLIQKYDKNMMAIFN